jgi:dihydroorotate dehydrogenase electron transfer subunit
MKQRAAVTVLENFEMARGVYRLVIADARGDGAVSDMAASAAPGQFVNIYLNNDSMLLPRPFGISDVESAGGRRRLVFVYAAVGVGTAELATYAPGTEIQALGPNGNGYDIEGFGRHILIIGGGLGIPPLLFAARRIREGAGPDGGAKITALLGYRDEPYYSDAMRPYCDEVFEISESGGRGAGGTVMDLAVRLVSDGALSLADAGILSCGPTPMLRAMSEWAASNGVPAQVSLEERMGCGYGACVGCTVEIRPGHHAAARADADGAATPSPVRRKVCKDGPVFPSDAIVWADQG